MIAIYTGIRNAPTKKSHMAKLMMYRMNFFEIRFWILPTTIVMITMQLATMETVARTHKNTTCANSCGETIVGQFQVLFCHIYFHHTYKGTVYMYYYP